jgi:hypothetical protein
MAVLRLFEKGRKLVSMPLMHLNCLSKQVFIGIQLQMVSKRFPIPIPKLLLSKNSARLSAAGVTAGLLGEDSPAR